MRIIGVCNRKGGSGKTTAVIHIAAELAARGLSVEVVDCDEQGSAAYWARQGALPMPVRHRPLGEGEQVTSWSRDIVKTKADCLVLDSPPHLDAALGAVVGLSDLAVVPCGPSGLDITATAETVALIREIRDARGKDRPLILLVPSRTDRRTSSGRALHGALADLGEAVGPELHARTAYVHACNTGQWVGSYAPNSPAHRETQALGDFILEHLRALR